MGIMKRLPWTALTKEKEGQESERVMYTYEDMLQFQQRLMLLLQLSMAMRSTSSRNDARCRARRVGSYSRVIEKIATNSEL